MHAFVCETSPPPNVPSVIRAVIFSRACVCVSVSACVVGPKTDHNAEILTEPETQLPYYHMNGLRMCVCVCVVRATYTTETVKKWALRNTRWCVCVWCSSRFCMLGQCVCVCAVRMNRDPLSELPGRAEPNPRRTHRPLTWPVPAHHFPWSPARWRSWPPWHWPSRSSWRPTCPTPFRCRCVRAPGCGCAEVRCSD